MGPQIKANHCLLHRFVVRITRTEALSNLKGSLLSTHPPDFPCKKGRIKTNNTFLEKVGSVRKIRDHQ